MITEQKTLILKYMHMKIREKLIEKLKDVGGLITGFLEIDESILSRADSLKCISVSGVGYSNIDMDAAKGMECAYAT